MAWHFFAVDTFDQKIGYSLVFYFDSRRFFTRRWKHDPKGFTDSVREYMLSRWDGETLKGAVTPRLVAMLTAQQIANVTAISILRKGA